MQKYFSNERKTMKQCQLIRKIQSTDYRRVDENMELSTGGVKEKQGDVNHFMLQTSGSQSGSTWALGSICTPVEKIFSM